LQISLLKYIVTCNAAQKENTNIAITWDVHRLENYQEKFKKLTITTWIKDLKRK
jgi:hypothetical protein